MEHTTDGQIAELDSAR